MATFTVTVPARDVDVELSPEEALRDINDRDLLQECRRRGIAMQRPEPSPCRAAVEAWTPESLAHDLRTAFYGRDASRFEAMATAIERSALLAEHHHWEPA